MLFASLNSLVQHCFSLWAAFLAVWDTLRCLCLWQSDPSAALWPGACCAPFSHIFHVWPFSHLSVLLNGPGRMGPPSTSTWAHNLPGSLLLEAPPVHAVSEQQDTTLYWVPNPSDTQGKEVAGLWKWKEKQGGGRARQIQCQRQALQWLHHNRRQLQPN